MLNDKQKEFLIENIKTKHIEIKLTENYISDCEDEVISGCNILCKSHKCVVWDICTLSDTNIKLEVKEFLLKEIPEEFI